MQIIRYLKLPFNRFITSTKKKTDLKNFAYKKIILKISFLFLILGMGTFFYGYSKILPAEKQVASQDSSDSEEKFYVDNKNIVQEERFITHKGKIKNKTVYEELRKIGISPVEIISLSAGFKNSFDFKDSRKGDSFLVKQNKEGSIEEFIYKTEILSKYIAKKDENGCFQVNKSIIKPDLEIKSSEFTIESCLYNAVIEGGEKRELVSEFTDIFSWDIDFYLYPKKGDKIQILYEKESVNDKFSGYGKILAAKYIGQKEEFSAYLFTDGKYSGYYDETGRPVKKMFLRVPVKFGVMTSSFSIRRFHPVLKKYKAHTGIDYGARKGTPIFATSNGRVIFSGWQNGYGKLIILRHPNGYKTYYGHCNSLIAGKGDFVEQGEIIARVGETGIATGPHVHYEVRINNKPVNPNTVKTAKNKPISKQNMNKFMGLVKLRSDLLNKVDANQKPDTVVAGK